jgi:methanogenic corrinoid protein MtbC1
MGELTELILGMRDEDSPACVKKSLADGADPGTVLDEAKEAMGVLGGRFERHEIFIPELMMAGEIMKMIAQELKPHIKADGAESSRGTIVIGTVEGDIHDIGKDIVVAMLDANGYEVHDIGIDVPAAKFVEAIRAHNPQVIGMSGLLTSVFDVMKTTVEAIAAAGLRDQVKIMVGGAPVDEQVMLYTGADGWGSDVAAALRMAEGWTTGRAA